MKKENAKDAERDAYLRALMGSLYDPSYYSNDTPRSFSTLAEPIREPVAPYNRRKADGKES